MRGAVKGVLGVSSPPPLSSILGRGDVVGGSKWGVTVDKGCGGWLRPANVLALMPGDFRFRSGHFRGYKLTWIC